jgi:hypothetical protein
MITAASEVRFLIRAGAFTAILSLLLADGALALLSPVGDQIEVSTTATQRASSPQVGMRADGSFVVVWQASGDEQESSAVEGRRFGTDGSALDEPFVVDDEPHAGQAEPAIAVQDRGPFLVAWSSAGEANASSMFARIFASDGEPVAPAFPLHDAAGDFARGPAAALDRDGFAVAWRQSAEVSGVRLTAAGSVRGAFSHAVAEPHRVSLGTLPGSRIALAWSSSHPATVRGWRSKRGRVEVAIVGTSGSEIEQLEANANRHRDDFDFIVDGERSLAISTGATGRFALTYDSAVPLILTATDQERGDSTLGAKLERFAPDAASRGSFFIASRADSADFSDVAMTPGGNVVTAMEENAGDNPAVWLRMLDCHGEPGQAVRVNAESSVAATGASVAVNELGDVVVVWSEQRTGTSDRGIVGRRFHLEGGCALCGDADANGRIAASDALATLRGSVGAGSCNLERCDTDASGQLEASDALRVLGAAVFDGKALLTCDPAPAGKLVASRSIVRLFANDGEMISGDGEATLLWWEEGYEKEGSVEGNRIDMELATSTIATMAGPVDNREFSSMSGCNGDGGLAVAWTNGPFNEFPHGITLDPSNVELRLPGVDAFRVHDNLVGWQRFSSIACLPGDRYAVAWTNYCGAVEAGSNYTNYYFPDECSWSDDGSYLRIFDANGVATTPAQWITQQGSPLLAAIDGDRFVVSANDRIRVRSFSGTTLQEKSAAAGFSRTNLACVGTLCARSRDARIDLFDANALASTFRSFYVRPDIQFGPERLIGPKDVSLACESGGTCVATWILVDDPGNALGSEYGVYARPFDVASGAVGETVWLQAAHEYTFDAPLASTGAGGFVVAVEDLAGYTLHRLQVQ